MNEKLKTIGSLFLVCLVCAMLGAVIGISYNDHKRSAQASELTAKYAAIQRERDTTIERITEDNQRLRDGAARAQAELDTAAARVIELEVYWRNASGANQSITASAAGARQNIEEASRIIASHLEAEQSYEVESDNRNPNSDLLGPNDRLSDL